MFNKLQPQPHDLKSTINSKQNQSAPSGSNIQSSETGEPEDSQTTKPIKPMTNLFGMKTPLAASTPVAGYSKSSQDPKSDSRGTTKPLEKLATKENVPERASENVPGTVQKAVEKKKIPKALSSQSSNKNFTFGVTSSTEAASDTSISSKLLLY